jgi:uncharacterized protein
MIHRQTGKYHLKNRRQWLVKTGLTALTSSFALSALASPVDALFAAIDQDDVTAVRAALARGADPNAVSADGQPALVRAIKADAWVAAQALLQNPKLQVDAPNRAGETSLMLAALKGRTDWMRSLLDRGAQAQRDGWSPMLYAATHAGPDAVAAMTLLASRGAALNARSPNGTTPVMMAARYGSEDAVRWLIAQGADWRTRNDRGLSVIDFAELAERAALVSALRDLERRSGRPIPPIMNQ